MSALITVQSVGKSFAERTVLTDVSLAVGERDRVAFIGINGSGKSTLLRLIAAAVLGERRDRDARSDADPTHDTVDSGLITKRRGLTFEYVPQEPHLAADATLETLLRSGFRAHAELRTELDALEADLERLEGDALGDALETHASLHAHLATLGGIDRDHEIHELAAGLGLPSLDRRAGELSIGERRRVALAMALLARPEVLALDEPTNHLDAHTVTWLQGQLEAQPGALLLVTHDRYFLDAVATRIIELDRGRAYGYEGGYVRFLEQQADRLEAQNERERVRRAFVRRELDWIRRGPKARTTKQQARIDRFDHAVAAGNEQRGAGKERPDERVLGLRLPTGPRLGKTVLEAHGLGKSLAGKVLFDGLELMLKPGDRLGIVGPNGAGKTTLVRTLLGQLPPDRGQVVVGQNTRFAFLDQGRAELDDTMSVLEAVAGKNDQVFLEDGPIHVRSFLRMLLFDDRAAEQRVGKLSGGERNRVQLAKLLRQGGNVLVLDEPTNDLDLITLGVLEAALSDFPGCALVVSHDRWFLDRVATGILAFEQDGKVTLYEGNYSSYLEKWSAQARPGIATRGRHAAVDNKAARPDSETKAAKKKKLSFKEQRELETIEAAIAAAEARVHALEAALAAPDVYSKRGAEVPQLLTELDAARADVERVYARWQELEAGKS